MKKKGVQSPAKITLKESSQTARVGPQEIILSDHSLKNEDVPSATDRWQRNRSPLAEKELSARTKAKSPQEKAMELAKAWPSLKGANELKQTFGKVASEAAAQKEQKQSKEAKAGQVREGDREGERGEEREGEREGEGREGERERKESWEGEVKEGEQVFPNGDTYIGTWKDKWIEGYGVYNFTKLNLQYRGQFKKSKQHGTGVLLRRPSGAVKEEEIYDGEWMNGEKHGLGKYYYFKDTFYDGDWYKNKKEGHGTFRSPEGEYVGQWKNDRKNGKGILRLKNGHTFDGRWVEDEFVEGLLVHSNGDRYDGEFENFSRHGFGTYTYTNRTTYRGNWVNNRKNGQGEIKYYNGDVYQGGMAADSREGAECHYSWATGEQVLGEFAADLPARGKVRLPAEGESEFNTLR